MVRGLGQANICDIFTVYDDVLGNYSLGCLEHLVVSLQEKSATVDTHLPLDASPSAIFWQEPLHLSALKPIQFREH